MAKILSIAPSWSETYESILNQGYVWIKTENGFITKDDVKMDKAAMSDYIVDDKITRAGLNSLRKYIEELQF